MCEISMPERSLYALADFPPHSIEDAKRMCVEKRFGGARTPEELLAILPRAKPFDNGVFLTPLAGLEGIYKFDVPLFKTIEKFKWDQLYNLAGVAEKPAIAPATTWVVPAATAAQELVLEEC